MLPPLPPTRKILIIHVLDKAPFHTGNANTTRKIFVPYNDCSISLLKGERPVSDSFLKRFRPSSSIFVGAEITTEPVIGIFESTTFGMQWIEPA